MAAHPQMIFTASHFPLPGRTDGRLIGWRPCPSAPGHADARGHFRTMSAFVRMSAPWREPALWVYRTDSAHARARARGCASAPWWSSGRGNKPAPRALRAPAPLSAGESTTNARTSPARQREAPRCRGTSCAAWPGSPAPAKLAPAWWRALGGSLTGGRVRDTACPQSRANRLRGV